MPTYEYECEACGKTFEEFQQISEKPKRKCPHCGKLKARRRIGAGAAVIFRGSGFYQTDYRSKEYKDQARAEKSGPSETKSSEKSSSSEKPSSSEKSSSSEKPSSSEKSSSSGGKSPE